MYDDGGGDIALKRRAESMQVGCIHIHTHIYVIIYMNVCVYKPRPILYVYVCICVYMGKHRMAYNQRLAQTVY